MFRVVAGEPVADRIEFGEAVIHRAADSIVGVDGLEALDKVKLVKCGNISGEDGLWREPARERDHFGGVVGGAVEAQVGFHGVAVFGADVYEGVVGIDADAADHVLTVGRMDAGGDACKERKRARRLDCGKLDGGGEAVTRRVVAVVLAEIRVERREPGDLCVPCLQDAGDAYALCT